MVVLRHNRNFQIKYKELWENILDKIKLGWCFKKKKKKK